MVSDFFSLAWKFLSSSPTIGWLVLALLAASGPEKIIKNLEDWATASRRFRAWASRKGWLKPERPILLVLGNSPESWHFKDNFTRLYVSIDALPFYFEDEEDYDIWINYKSVRREMAGRFVGTYWRYLKEEQCRFVFEEITEREKP
ncbi:MAG: hypothetical protein ISN26_02365 [Betaproteobacteria bacterium AqS2]|uniref:Uncharacterized protein n=1 Tax=Candidatus Amphirhobacter heronislandensis TaxID=1732024 RepID=A0A930UC97_9GAMM|nr:hypothetical protein [Betaproteobacteria bacterium AqS2]